jgi:hypothetical protein
LSASMTAGFLDIKKEMNWNTIGNAKYVQDSRRFSLNSASLPAIATAPHY